MHLALGMQAHQYLMLTPRLLKVPVVGGVPHQPGVISVHMKVGAASFASATLGGLILEASRPARQGGAAVLPMHVPLFR